MTPESTDLLRDLPSVSDFLSCEDGTQLASEFGAGLTKSSLRHVLDQMRGSIRRGTLRSAPDTARIAHAVRSRNLRFATVMGRRAVNATGILLHTGLGRAPYCKEALDVLSIADHYSILQTNPESGKRSLREEKVQSMLCELTGCEAATVVNNNAAATMLILNTLAENKEAIVSRGQLVEIGGAFRLPDVMTMSNVILRDVGCTNRTHLRDYENAITEETGVLIHVHTSNYRVRGFSSTPDIAELCSIGKKTGLPVIDDLGSGALVPLSAWGLPDEPLVRDSVKAGATAACFSADKLISGPQGGIILGSKDVIQRVRKNPFARMFRVCKLTLAALETTLIHFLNGTHVQSIPFYRMLSFSVDELRARAQDVCERIHDCGCAVDIVETVAQVGSGSIPDQGIPSIAVQVKPKPNQVDAIALSLRTGTPSVFCRIQDDALLFDMRTLFADELLLLAERIRASVQSA